MSVPRSPGSGPTFCGAEQLRALGTRAVGPPPSGPADPSDLSPAALWPAGQRSKPHPALGSPSQGLRSKVLSPLGIMISKCWK